MMKKTVDDFSTLVRKAISAGDLNFALTSILELVERLLRQPLCTAKIFGSSLLDQLCRDIGNEALGLSGLSIPYNPVADITVWIATELYASGGHAAVMEDFIRYGKPGRHVILLTDLFGTTQKKVVERRYASDSVSMEFSPNTSLFGKLEWMIGRLATLKPKRVYLFNHHQDVVAIASVQAVPARRLFFVHHGDHQLCLGVHLEHAIHIDLHPMGYHTCRGDLRLSDNRYIPMVVEDRGVRDPEKPFMVGGVLTTCTAARANKVEVPYPYRYDELVPIMLELTRGRHIHIGTLSPWTLRRIAKSLQRLGIAKDRFIYIPWVPSVWQALHQHGVDVYLSSFPLGGGRTNVEALGAGIPPILHQHYGTRLLGGVDMMYPEAMVWRSPDELYSILRSLSHKLLALHSALGRQHYERFHRPEVLRGLLSDDPEHAERLPVPDLRPFQGDTLQVCLDMHRQCTNPWYPLRNQMMWQLRRRLKWLRARLSL